MLNTLESMEKNMEGTWSKWHFNGDERYGSYPGCPVLGGTYKGLAERILKKHSISKNEEIKDKLQSIMKKLDNLEIFKIFPELNKDHIIMEAIGFPMSVNEPSVNKTTLNRLHKDSLTRESILMNGEAL